MNIFVYTNLSTPDKAAFRQAVAPLHTLIFRNEVSSDAYQAHLEWADVLMGNPPAAMLSSLPRLRFWQLESAGFDKYRHVKTQALVANMGDFFAWPCAETTVGGILALYRRLDELAVLQRQQKWVGTPLRYTMRLLHQQQVVILGKGTIGQAIQQILAGFGCSIRLMARTQPDAQLHSLDDLLAALPHTDLLINTLPGSADGFVSAQVLSALKPGSVYANVGRGNTTDERALIENLQSGHLDGAVLDVTVEEPLPTESPLWSLPNVLLTQHTGGGQRNEDLGKVAQFLRNLAHLENNEPLENQVDLERGY